MDSEQPEPQPSTSTATASADHINNEQVNGEQEETPHESENTHQEESVAERFARLCEEVDAASSSSNADPALPDLPSEQAQYLARNASGDLYMIPDAVSAAEGPDTPSVLAAFRAALADIYGDDDVEGTIPTPMFLQESCKQSDEHKTETPNPDSKLSFCALAGFPDFEPSHIDNFSWEDSLSKKAIDSFVSSWKAEKEEQERLDAEEAAAAMARAAAASAGRPRTQPREQRPQVKRRYSFNADPVVWAAQEDAAASAVLKELRTNLGKLRKGSSKAPPENSAIWTLVGDGKGKLKPEAAAEMARAKVAAAAAVAAMRDAEPDPLPADSLQDLKRGGIGSVKKGEAGLSFEQQDTRRANSNYYDEFPHNLLCSTNPGFPRALSLDSSTRLKNVSKKKRVEFAAGTVFVKK